MSGKAGAGWRAKGQGRGARVVGWEGKGQGGVCRGVIGKCIEQDECLSKSEIGRERKMDNKLTEK